MAPTLDLNGTWQFQLDPTGALAPDALNPDRSIAVPMPWQAALPELREYGGYAFYRRTVAVEASFLALGEARLHFGAVDYWCQVWLNDTLLGEHEGGYTPFSFLVGKHLRPGENSVTLRVFDPVQREIVLERWPNEGGRRDGMMQRPFDAREVPHGKQEWYINVGGIWQNVWLEAVPPVFIEHVHVTPDIENNTATVRVRLGGETDQLGSAALRISIVDAAGADVGEAETNGLSATISIPQPHLWTLDDPHLYTTTATLTLPDGKQHSVSQRFGMRAFGHKNGQFHLNGEPLYLLSALDQDLYPDTIYTPPSDDFLRDQFRKAKELGLNNLRCHIKPPDPRYLDLCDEMGLLVWAEIPSWHDFAMKGTIHGSSDPVTQEVRARVEGTLEAMIARDFNHPSLVIWTLVNEDWGTTLYFSPEDRAWVADLYDRCKQLDPTRLVVDNSACGGGPGPNIHVKSDIDDFHMYMSIPDSAGSFATAVEQLALRPLWTYSAHGDTQRTGNEPLVLSEFGNWGLPSLKALREHHGGEPHWFDLGPWWSRWEGEAGWPQGVEERFAKLGLGAIWPDYEAFATATQWHQFESMKLEIEAMRRLPTLAGYVITEFTDAYWEANGLLDFARNPKAYHDTFKQVNNADVVLAFPARRAFWADERARVPLYASHFSGGASDGATLRWQLEGGTGGEIVLGPLPRGATRQVAVLRLALPNVETTQVLRLTLALVGPGGDELTTNALTLTVYPSAARRPKLSEPVAVITNTPAFGSSEPPQIIDGGGEGAAGGTQAAAATEPADESSAPDRPLLPLVAAAGYQTTDALGDDVKLAITNMPTAALLEWVRAGGDLLFISEGPSPFFFVQGRGGAYGGHWVTCYNWLRPEAHPRLAPANPLGMAYAGVTPQGVIVGLPLEEAQYQSDVLAGMVSGWAQHAAAHTVQFRYGKGRVVMTTFRLRESLGRNPTATALLHDLVDHLRSEQCQPTLAASF